MNNANDFSYWLDWSANALKANEKESAAEAISRALGVSVRTVRAWRAKNKAPKWALSALMQLVTGLPHFAGDQWQGWRFRATERGAVLTDPRGHTYTPDDLARLEDTRAHLALLQRQFAPGAQLTWRAHGTGQRTSWPGDAVPAWQQFEEALRAIIDDALDARDRRRIF